MKQDPNPRHRRITLRILEFAYGPGLTPEARECLAREFFRNFVLFAWETMELLLGLLGDSSVAIYTHHPGGGPTGVI